MTFMVWLMMIASNYAYQYMRDGDWDAAFERSYFQGVALLILWLMQLGRTGLWGNQ